VVRENKKPWGESAKNSRGNRFGENNIENRSDRGGKNERGIKAEERVQAVGCVYEEVGLVLGSAMGMTPLRKFDKKEKNSRLKSCVMKQAVKRYQERESTYKVGGGGNSARTQERKGIQKRDG